MSQVFLQASFQCNKKYLKDGSFNPSLSFKKSSRQISAGVSPPDGRCVEGRSLF